MKLDPVSEAMIARLGWTLMHTVWIGAAAGGVHAVIIARLRQRAAHARYLASCVMMTLFVAGTVAAFVLQAGAGNSVTAKSAVSGGGPGEKHQYRALVKRDRARPRNRG